MIEVSKNEIIETQKAKTDLMKWKLILVATLGAFGLGFTSQIPIVGTNTSYHLILGLVPLVCIYTDLISNHLQLRILVISKFFQNYKSQEIQSNITMFSSYVRFCESVRPVFKLEDLAERWSTVFLSALVILFSTTIHLSKLTQILLLVSGSFGIFFSIILNNIYKNKTKILNKSALNFFELSE
jgi:hypothetical protein